MLSDRYGLELSTRSNTARDAYVEAVDAILGAAPGVQAILEQALGADPEFALAHVALARHFQLGGKVAEARASAERAAQLAGSVTERERRHIEIYHLLVNGRGGEALERIRAHVALSPLDALALSPACSVFGLIGFSGRIDREPEQLALLEPLAEQFGNDWWFLTVYAFALVEMGRWQEGRELVERALAANPRSAHTAHVRAHALYEAGEDQVALDFLREWLPEYDAEGAIHCHLWWHYCLAHLLIGEDEAVWPIYDARCAPAVSLSPPINILTDGASLLWRAELAGHARDASRWTALKAYHEQRFPAPMVFVDTHAALPLVALGSTEALAEYTQTLETLGEDGKLPAGTVPARLARAFSAYGEGHWGNTIDMLEPMMDEVVRIGGSRAQRDLVTWTLLAAYANDGRVDDARRFVAAREDRRPSVPLTVLAS